MCTAIHCQRHVQHLWQVIGVVAGGRCRRSRSRLWRGERVCFELQGGGGALVWWTDAVTPQGRSKGRICSLLINTCQNESGTAADACRCLCQTSSCTGTDTQPVRGSPSTGPVALLYTKKNTSPDCCHLFGNTTQPFFDRSALERLLSQRWSNLGLVADRVYLIRNFPISFAVVSEGLLHCARSSRSSEPTTSQWLHSR
jgi:hypothetical protein